MSKVKWVGIIDGVSKYQSAEYDPDAIKLDMPKSSGAMMLHALPFLLPSLAVLIPTVFLKLYFEETPPVYPPYMLIGIAIGLLLLPVHELLHGAVFPRGATVYIGFYPKAFAFMALCSYPLSRRRFVLMSIIPYLLGLIPFIVFAALPSTYIITCSILFGAAMIGLITPYPDLYNVYKVMRNVPRGGKVYFDGDDTLYISPETRSEVTE